MVQVLYRYSFLNSFLGVGGLARIRVTLGSVISEAGIAVSWFTSERCLSTGGSGCSLTLSRQTLGSLGYSSFVMCSILWNGVNWLLPLGYRSVTVQYCALYPSSDGIIKPESLTRAVK